MPLQYEKSSTAHGWKTEKRIENKEKKDNDSKARDRTKTSVARKPT